MGALDGPAPICHVAPMAGRVPVRTHTANVLVIGSGGAGLRAAIAAHQAGAEVVVVGKRPRARRAHGARVGRDQRRARHPRPRGLVAAALRRHARRRATSSATRASSRSWRARRRRPSTELAEWGCDFARTDDGRIDQRFFGAHRWRRTCYAGDYSGRAILHTLAAKVAELGIPIVDEHYVSRLLIADGACFGALAFDLHDGSRTAFVADAVVLCGGGHTRIWRRSSSRRDENFGEAMALALRAGLPGDGHGARAVPPDRHGRARGGRRHARDRGRARRGRSPLQRRSASASWRATTRSAWS